MVWEKIPKRESVLGQGDSRSKGLKVEKRMAFGAHLEEWRGPMRGQWTFWGLECLARLWVSLGGPWGPEEVVEQ